MNPKNYKNAELINAILILHAFVIIILLAYFGKLLFIPLFFSFLLALFLHPLCNWFEVHGLNRLVSSILCILILLLSCAVIIYFVGSQFQRFVKDLPSLKNNLNTLIQSAQTWLQQHYNIDDSTQSGYLSKLIDGLVKGLQSALAGILFIIIYGTLTVFFIFYMLVYRADLRTFILSFFTRTTRNSISDILKTLHSTITNYIKGLLTEILILILLSCFTLVILGVKYAILMAFFAGMLNIIPYIGIYAAIFLNVFITISSGNSTQSLEVLLVFAIIHIIDANVITPFIVGRRIKINPLATLIAVVTGNLIWGIPGMFLFIPLVAILNIILEKLRTEI